MTLHKPLNVDMYNTISSFIVKEEPLFVNLVKRKFLKSMNESLRDNCETVLVKDELLQIRHK